MGLFSNKKKLCPICGDATPRLFPTVVEGMPICKACKRKVNLPEGALDNMSLDAFRQYMAFHQENQPLRDRFHETLNWASVIRIDRTQRLFRLSGDEEEGLVMEASCLKAFRILEDDRVLFESGPEGLRCYDSDIQSRVQTAAPMIAQFEIQLRQYEQIEELIKQNREKNDSASYRYTSRPTFDYQILTKGFTLEVTLEHPYWNGTFRWTVPGPRLDDTYPSINDFMRKYEKQTEEVHILAVQLMAVLNPGAPECQMGAQSVSGVRTIPTVSAAPADPVAEIQKYKGLLDSGVITEEEFAAKKRQLLGI